MPAMRQLPDGTWLNEDTGTVSAPLQDPMGGGAPKRSPAPPETPVGTPLLPARIAPQAQNIAGAPDMLPGMGRYVNASSYSPNGLAGLSPGLKKVILLGSIVGVATLTVWLQNRSGSKKSAKK